MPSRSRTAGSRFSPEEWKAVREETRSVLRRVAEERRTITYGELVAEVSGRRIPARSGMLTRLLGEVCETEDEAYGIMLGSVVVRADSGIPGDGYFRHAEALGRDVSDREGFWRAELERVYSVWTGHGQGRAS